MPLRVYKYLTRNSDKISIFYSFSVSSGVALNDAHRDAAGGGVVFSRGAKRSTDQQLTRRGKGHRASNGLGKGILFFFSEIDY